MSSRSAPPGPSAGQRERLDERSRRVLGAIVRDYIQGGEPVGSHAIARRPDVDVSSATVRAVMADLEEMGYLEKPHTSAGRIPTARGYRYYVDTLLRVKPPLPEEREQIERRAHEATQLDALMTNASRVLHSLTRHAGVIAAPRPQSERLARIEFLQLREGRVLAVLVARSGTVRNRLLTLPVGMGALDHAANYLNSLVDGLTLAEAQARVRRELERDKSELSELQARALALGAQAVQADETAVRIEGQASLLDSKLDLGRMRSLLQALEEKQQLIDVLDRTLEAQELRIYIGAESGLGGDGFAGDGRSANARSIGGEPDLAIVAAPYRMKGEVVGALGVIGPTRMDYARVVPLVELTAKAVGMTLDDG